MRVAGVQFVATNLDDATRGLIELAASDRGSGTAVRLVNTYSVAAAHEDPAYWKVVTGPGMNLPDGKPIGVLMNRRLRGAVERGAVGQVRGPSLFVRVITHPDNGVGHFFLGTTQTTLDALVQRLRSEAAGARVAGAWAPPFTPMGPDLVALCVEKLASVHPSTIVWVALGTPKQDLLAAEVAQRTGLVCVGVGAAFDFYAGSVREAPVFLRRLGLEWLFRLGSDPKRLWRRYTFGSLRFVRAAIADRGAA